MSIYYSYINFILIKTLLSFPLIAISSNIHRITHLQIIQITAVRDEQFNGFLL